jgi:hypothetical protein
VQLAADLIVDTALARMVVGVDEAIDENDDD